jgi:hypothetical protein
MRQTQIALMQLAIHYSEVIDFCNDTLKSCPGLPAAVEKKEEAIEKYTDTMVRLVMNIEAARPVEKDSWMGSLESAA